MLISLFTQFVLKLYCVICICHDILIFYNFLPSCNSDARVRSSASSSTISAGTTFTLTCDYTSSPLTPTIQWLFKSSPLSSETNPTLPIVNPAGPDSGIWKSIFVFKLYVQYVFISDPVTLTVVVLSEVYKFILYKCLASRNQ